MHIGASLFSRGSHGSIRLVTQFLIRITSVESTRRYINAENSAGWKHTSRILHRFIFTSPTLSKKFGKVQGKRNEADLSGPNDPFDFTELETGIADAQAKLKEDLSKLRAGGRFNSELLENLRVKTSKRGEGAERLGDLAQVIPKGRVLQVLVGEKDHVKPVVSSIQSSDLSLNPQIDPHNALQLNVNLPPPTKESRQQIIVTATKAAEAAANKVKNLRQAQQKKLRMMQLSKAARPDDLKKAGDKMEAIVEKGAQAVKGMLSTAQKALDS